jgi:hypothetical protein
VVNYTNLTALEETRVFRLDILVFFCTNNTLSLSVSSSLTQSVLVKSEKCFFQELKERLCRLRFTRRGGVTLKPVIHLQCIRSSHAYLKEKINLIVLRVEGYRNALAQFRMGVSPINVHRYCFSSVMENKLCPICRE